MGADGVEGHGPLSGSAMPFLGCLSSRVTGCSRTAVPAKGGCAGNCAPRPPVRLRAGPGRDLTMCFL